MSTPLDYLESSPLPAATIRGGRYVYVNAAFVEFLGWPRDKLIGMDFFEPVAPEDRERVRERHAKRLRGEPVPNSYQFGVVRADGQRRIVEIFVAQMGADTILQLHDLTDRAFRRENLAKLAGLGASVQRARSDAAIFDTVQDGLAEISLWLVRLVPGREGVKVVAHHLPGNVAAEFESKAGVEIAELRGGTLPGIQQALADGAAYVDDAVSGTAQFVGSEHAELARSLQLREQLGRSIVLRLDVASGPSQFFVVFGDWIGPEDLPAFRLFGTQVSAALDNARLYAEANRRVAEISIVHEVGRSLLSTLELEQVLDRGVENLARIVTAPEAQLLLLDASGEHLVIRAAAKHREVLGTMLAIHPVESSLAARTFASKKPISVEESLTSPLVNAALRDRFQFRAYLSLPLVVRERAIGVAVIMDSAGPRRFSDNEIERAAAVANQLAIAVENARLYEDLQRSYVDLARAQEQLVQRERLAALGELAAVVAHEVRNPLGVIFNSLGSLRRLVRLEGDAKMLVDIIGEESERLNRIVSDMLDFARPSVPAIRLEPLDRLLEDAAGSALVDVTDRICLEREIDASLPPVPFDMRLLRQAILNVAINAVQSMSGKGTLTLRARREAGVACIEISDTGPGIPEEHLPRIFEPFFTTKATGTGLGLAVVKRIVEGHRGEIAVASAPGNGTTFTIKLPLEPETGRLVLSVNARDQR
jgi:PAS domain S-box-containing protein